MTQMAQRQKLVKRFRGRGLLFAIEIQTAGTKKSRSEIVESLFWRTLDKGINLSGSEGRDLSITAPLTITERELMDGLDGIEEAVAEEWRELASSVSGGVAAYCYCPDLTIFLISVKLRKIQLFSPARAPFFFFFFFFFFFYVAEIEIVATSLSSSRSCDNAILSWRRYAHRGPERSAALRQILRQSIAGVKQFAPNHHQFCV